MADLEQFTSLFVNHERQLHGFMPATLGYRHPAKAGEWHSSVLNRAGTL